MDSSFLVEAEGIVQSSTEAVGKDDTEGKIFSRKLPVSSGWASEMDVKR